MEALAEATAEDGFGSVARAAAERLCLGTGAGVAGVYLSDRRGGQVLQGSCRRRQSAERLHTRLWWKGGPGWRWGGDGHYLVTPFTRDDESGVVVLGPWPTPDLGRRTTRRLEQSIRQVVADLTGMLRSERGLALEDDGDVESRAYRMGRAITGSDHILLEAARRELDADQVTWDGGHLSVEGQRRDSPLAVATVEAWLSARPPLGDEALHRRITAYALADVADASSPETAGHGQSVAQLAVVAGSALRLSSAELGTVDAVARLQNVGMSFLGHAASRRSRLERSERVNIERHPVVGAALLDGAGFDAEVVSGVRYHHERWDGEGYPDRLAGEQIPLVARLVSCADVFVALTSDRPWRPALPTRDAIAYLGEGAGRQFDPACVRAVVSSQSALAA